MHESPQKSVDGRNRVKSSSFHRFCNLINKFSVILMSIKRKTIIVLNRMKIKLQVKKVTKDSLSGIYCPSPPPQTLSEKLFLIMISFYVQTFKKVYKLAVQRDLHS